MAAPWMVVFALIVGPWLSVFLAMAAWRNRGWRMLGPLLMMVQCMAAVAMAAWEVLKHG